MGHKAQSIAHLYGLVVRPGLTKRRGCPPSRRKGKTFWTPLHGGSLFAPNGHGYLWLTHVGATGFFIDNMPAIGYNNLDAEKYRAVLLAASIKHPVGAGCFFLLTFLNYSKNLNSSLRAKPEIFFKFWGLRFHRSIFSL